MGMYINPTNGQTKEEWLKDNIVSDFDGRKPEFPTGANTAYLPVVLVDNFNFTALGVAFDEREFRLFNSPNDDREKHWYLVTKESLLDPKAGLEPHHVEYLSK
jgi:hypothetical protein